MPIKKTISALFVILCFIVNPAFADSGYQKSPFHLFSNLLPHTDGYGLLPKPPGIPREESKKLFEVGSKSCDSGCATSFGEVLGKADGAIGRSNCRPTCIRPQYSFLDLTTGAVSVHKDDPKDSNLHYIGLIYQCVEYSRKWWMKNKSITYRSVDSAYEILYLTEGKDIRSNKTFPLARSINGTAQRPPKRGDLVIYHPTKDDPKWRYGHVAVVVATDPEKGTVSLAEQNYTNKSWEDPEAYARKIRLFEIGGRYTLLDIPAAGIKNPGGAHISGWIYPLADQ
ncbi:MAG: CHAP domain-containing protein [Gammaproteobacteria bacterium]|nr:CHAP domain-containing protein [Gammaproteobacteria bacterium]